MNIIQCSLCKRPFQSMGGKTCGECLVKLDEDFIKVRDYISENKRAGIEVVSEETGVSKQAILHLLKDGRLIIDDPQEGGMLLCEACRKPISTGRLCKECKNSVASTMQKSIAAHKTMDQQKKDAQNLKGTAKVNR